MSYCKRIDKIEKQPPFNKWKVCTCCKHLKWLPFYKNKVCYLKNSYSVDEITNNKIYTVMAQSSPPVGLPSPDKCIYL